MRQRKEKGIRFLTLRALVITLLVLLSLSCLTRLGIIGIEADVPASQVEEAIWNN